MEVPSEKIEKGHRRRKLYQPYPGLGAALPTLRGVETPALRVNAQKWLDF
jgi:hypothetical protein